MAGIVVAVAVVALIVGGLAGYVIRGAVDGSSNTGTGPSGTNSEAPPDTAEPEPTAVAPTAPTVPVPTIVPPNAVTDLSGIKVNPEAPADAPQLVIYQDYQCPWCAYFDEAFSPTIKAAVAQNQIRLEYHTMHFLDYANAQVGSTNLESSSRAAVAAACADFAGVYGLYHDLVYANQPETEGDGFSDDLLRRELATQAGIAGDDLTSFQRCYDNQETLPFVQYAAQMASLAGVTGTPMYVLNGTQISINPDDPQSLQQALDAVL
jgi:protein-disulfide isomerase